MSSLFYFIETSRNIERPAKTTRQQILNIGQKTSFAKRGPSRNIEPAYRQHYTCICDLGRIKFSIFCVVSNTCFLNKILVCVLKLNDLLIICDQAGNEYDSLKPKSPLNLVGVSVSSNVNAFNNVKYPLARIRSNSTGRVKENSVKPENGIAINVPCIGKVFRFYARLNLEKDSKN